MDKDAMAKSILILLALVLLAAASSGQRQHGGGAATASDDDEGGGDNLQQWQDAMKEAVKVFSSHNPDTDDPRVLKRACGRWPR
jgi:ABC-type glycerol-3-phosphate transport system substrate-binding protein